VTANPERRRRSIRLKNFDYSRPGHYFVTLCVFEKECIFGGIENGVMTLNKYGEIVQAAWKQTPMARHNVKLDEFIIMPNHLHGIMHIFSCRGDPSDRPSVGYPHPSQCMMNDSNSWASQRGAPTLKSGTIGASIGQFKSISCKRIRQCGTPGFHWQRNYYERIIRNGKELTVARAYIAANPGNWAGDEENISEICENQIPRNMKLGGALEK